MTLGEIARLAAHLGEPVETFFPRAVKSDLSPAFGTLVLAKRPDGLCLLEDEHGRCTVHPVKPRLCRAFVCLEHPDGAPGDAETLALLGWLYDSPEAEATRRYVARHGAVFHAEGFAALVTI